MKKLYLNRLQIFATHIASIKNHPEEGLFRTTVIYAFVGKVKIHVEVKSPHWVFEELVSCFKDEWSFDEQTGAPILDEMEPNRNTAECVCDFFGIRDYELFCHLFDLDGYQSLERWSGKKLTEESGGPDIAHNIFEYVKSQKRTS